MARVSPHKLCDGCGLYKPCVNPLVRGQGTKNMSNKYIFILPYPEHEDEQGAKFGGKRSQTVIQSIEKYLPPGEEYFVTYLIKCPTFENTVSRRGFKEPEREHVDFCMKHLAKELFMYPDAKIMGFGKFVFDVLTKAPKDAKFMKEVGSKKKVNIAGREFDFIPNIDPGMIYRQPQFQETLDNYIKKFMTLQHDEDNAQATEDKYKIFDYEESMQAMDEVIDLYKSGEIQWSLFDIENSVSLNPWEGGEILMYSFSHPKIDYGFIVPLYVTNEVHWPEDQLPYTIPRVDFTITDTERAKLNRKVGQFLEEVPIVGHQLKYDLKWCGWKKVCNIEKVKIYADTHNSAFQLLNKGPGILLNLKDLSRKYFNVTDAWEDEIWDYLNRFRLTKDRHFGKLPTGFLGRYSGLDSFWNVRLQIQFEGMLTDNEKKLCRMVDNAIIPFADSEIKGMHIDTKMHDFLRSSYNNYIDQKLDLIYNLPTVKKMAAPLLSAAMAKNQKKKVPEDLKTVTREAFNLNGPKITPLVFSKEGYDLPVNKQYTTDKGAPQFNKDAREWLLESCLSVDKLAEVQKKHPKLYDFVKESKDFVTTYSEYKRVAKLLNDYVETMPESIYQGIYRSVFNLNGTTTGRLSSPFHSIPNRCDIKRLFDSRWKDEGGFIMAADYSQLELRVVAALSNETKLIEAFKKGIDIHTFTASEIYGIPVEKVTEEQRGVGKTSNFAMLYGKTAHNLAADLGISLAEAERILKMFYASMNNLTAWMKERQKETAATGYVVTKFGRKIPVHSAFSTAKHLIAETDRLAVNYPVQSGASDLVFDSVNSIWYRKQKEKAKSIFLATVHDSLEHDIYPGEVFKMAQIIKEEGIDQAPIKHPWMTCPLELSMEFGLSWGGCLKGEVSDLTDKSLKFSAKGLRKDFNLLLATARKAYNVDITVKEEKPLTPANFKDDIFFRDGMQWKADVYLSAK